MKLIISDLDGTLLNDEGKVSKKSIETLRKIKNMGYEIAIATGRSFNSASKIRDEIGVEMYLICNNGANIYNKDSSILKTNLIPSDLSKKIIELLTKEKIDYKAFRDMNVYMPSFAKIHEEIKSEHKLNYVEDINIISELEKILIIEENEKRILEIKLMIEKTFINDLEIVISSPDCLDLNMKNCTKKYGVEVISKELGIETKDIMAFGDSGNDYKMLKYVGYPVAMKDSYMSTKGFKNITYFRNEEDGVADYLYKYFIEN